MKIYSLSASKIKTFKQCQFKYYLSYHLGLDLGTSFAAEQGNLVHVIFEKIGEDLKQGVPLKESYMYNNWQKEVLYAYEKEGLWTLSPDAKNREKFCSGCEFNLDGLCQLVGKPIDDFGGCPKNEYEDAIDLCKKVINNKEVLYPLDKKIINVEDSFKINIPDGNNSIVVNGIIDVVTELDQDTVEIVDYKSGKHEQSYNECKKDPQLLIYNLACRRNYSKYKNVFITIYYLRKKGPLTLTFEPKDEVGTENALKYYYEKISSINSPQRRCDKYGEGTSYDWACEKMCNIDICNKHFQEFKENGHKILDPPEKPERKRKKWLQHLMEDSNKDKAFKNFQGKVPILGDNKNETKAP